MAVNINIKLNKNLKFLWESLEKIRDARSQGLADYQYLLLEGSSRSGKTWAILIFLITLCLQPQRLGLDKIVVRAYRNDGTTCEDTIVADFITIMSSFFGGFDASKMNDEIESIYERGGNYNIARKTYTFFNGSTLSFHGANEPQKLQGKSADITWLNEAMEITDDARTQLEFRTRQFIICDWNPSLNYHWIFSSIQTDSRKYLYCHSTYADNIENLTASQIANIEKYKPTAENIRLGSADNWRWLVYGEGKRGVREHTVFERWRWDVIPDEDFPIQRVCQRFGYGLDFGFSVDPTAFVKCALWNDCIFVHQLIYETGLLFGKSYDRPDAPSIVGQLDWMEIDKNARIHADKSAGEGITQIKYAGYNVWGTDKGKGSILDGINIMKQHRIFVTRSSAKIIEEFENYCWKKKSDGTITSEPEDKFNHGIDAIRYWALDNLSVRVIPQASTNEWKPIVRSSDSFGMDW